MAEILYRETATGPIPVATSVKNAMLTNAEMDGNIRSIVSDLANKVSTSALDAGIQEATDSAVAMAIALG